MPSPPAKKFMGEQTIVADKEGAIRVGGEVALSVKEVVKELAIARAENQLLVGVLALAI